MVIVVLVLLEPQPLQSPSGPSASPNGSQTICVSSLPLPPAESCTSRVAVIGVCTPARYVCCTLNVAVPNASNVKLTLVGVTGKSTPSRNVPSPNSQSNHTGDTRSSKFSIVPVNVTVRLAGISWSGPASTLMKLRPADLKVSSVTLQSVSSTCTSRSVVCLTFCTTMLKMPLVG